MSKRRFAWPTPVRRPADWPTRAEVWNAALVAPTDEALRHRLEELYQATGAHRELASLFLEDAAAARDVAGRFAALVRAGSALFLQPPGTLMMSHAAIEPLREARALRPGNLEATTLLADALTGAHRNGEAFELLTAAVASHKGRRSRELARHAIIASRGWLGRTASAPARWPGYATALDMDAQNGVVAAELAAVAMKTGKLEVAQRALGAVTMLRGSSPMSKALAYQRLGEMAKQQGDLKRAALLWKRAIDDDPTLETARSMLAALSTPRA